jgi:hypothetical protein
LLAESSAIPIFNLVLVRARFAAIANASGIDTGDAVQGVDAAACVAEQNTADGQRVMDSPPSLKVFPYHLWRLRWQQSIRPLINESQDREYLWALPLTIAGYS